MENNINWGIITNGRIEARQKLCEYFKKEGLDLRAYEIMYDICMKQIETLQEQNINKIHEKLIK